MLYSYQGGVPTTLPFRIFLSNGASRTDPSTFTNEELTDAGFTGPYNYPEYDLKVQTVDWNGSEFVLRPYNEEEISSQWELIRQQRNQLLKDCDWSQVSDYSFNLDNSVEWIKYRQSLRDLPNLQDNPFDIHWPSIPK